MGTDVKRIRQGVIRFTILVSVLTLCGCAQLEESSSGSSTIEGFPDQELYSATIRFTQAGQPRFNVKAEQILRFEINDLILLRGNVEVDLFNGFGEHTALITADEGDVIEKDKQLIARGNVVVRSDSGMVLYADTLYYNRDVDRVISDGFVIMVSPQDSLAGYGFSAAPNLDDWEIKNTSGATWRRL